MLKKIRKYKDIDERKLMDIYAESNYENTDYFYPDEEDKSVAVRKVEEGFLGFLKNDFFKQLGAEYWVLEEGGIWVSAARTNYVEGDIYLLEALETRPDSRRRGYAVELLKGIVEEKKKEEPFRLKSYVGKKNEASLKSHLKSGFEIVSDKGFKLLGRDYDSGSYGLEYNNAFSPRSIFPEDKKAPTKEDLLVCLEAYGIKADGMDIGLIDTSHDKDDIRLNYLIDKKWVLRITNAPEMTEERFQDLNRLIDRYIDFGLKCPRFIADKDGKFLHEWDGWTCYLQEYIDLTIVYDVHRKLDQDVQDAIWQEVLDCVAGFAEKYRNVDLSDTYGMYSLFDLAPYDIPIGKDEKQQNFESLCQTLTDMGEKALVERLEKKHSEVREKIKAVYCNLPRCVFQGDENFSNVLMTEDYHLAGFIDFNMAGTEVIVNQFANLGGGLKDREREPIGAKARLDYAIESYHKYQGRMLEFYHANDLEKKAIEWYVWISWIAGWPHVCFFLDGLKDEKLKDEVLELLGLLADYELPK